jgi:FO synthase subunit 1
VAALAQEHAERITWSPSVTLVPSRQCFNACGYCGFRRDPDPPPLPGGEPADALSDAAALAALDQRPQALEVLLLSGEVAPQAPGRRAWFGRLLALSRLALVCGRLPHTNAGPLSLREMAALGRLNPSMGLMLEGLGPAYDRLHRRAPSKALEIRLGQIEQAGRLGIAFTTGLLLGVGESRAERLEALELLALMQQQWGHIQEVILQPWRPDGAGPQPLAADEVDELLELIAAAREILPPEVHLQLPPNLWPLERLVEAIDAGIDDLGGIDLHDVINPAYGQRHPDALAGLLAAAGWRLQPRLCVHAEWLDGLTGRLRRQVEACRRRLEHAC